MTPLTASLVWCVLQVTAFSVAAAVLYLVGRWVAAGAGRTVLNASLLLVLGLTAVAASPWPAWRWPAPRSQSVVTAADAPAAADAPGAEVVAPRPVQPELASTYAAAWRGFTEALTQPPPAAEATAAGPTRTVVSFIPWLVALFLCVGAGRLLIGFWQIRGLLGRSMPVDDGRLAALANELKAGLQLATETPLRESPDVATPATIGWKQPTILLPPTWRDWTEDEARAVLAHELAHVAAGDYRSWIVGRMAVAVHFYHPVVHWLARRLQLEQELAADAAAARLLGDRKTYLHCLASLALATPPHRLAGPAKTLIPSRSLLLRRVEMLRTAARPLASPVQSRRLSGASAVVLAFVALAIAGVRQPPTSQAAEPTTDDTFVAFEPAERIPLSVVPADTTFAYAIRPAELLAHEAYDPLIKELNSIEPLKTSELSARDIWEAMVFVRGESKSGERAVIRCVTPKACLALTNGLLSGMPEGQGLEADFDVLRTRTLKITRLDERTIVVDRLFRDDSNAPPLHSPVSQKWEAEWKLRDKAPLVGAISVAALRLAIGEERTDEAFRQFPMSSFRPVVDHTEWAVGAIGLEDKLSVDAVAVCDSEDNAEQVASVFQALITLGGGMLQQQRLQSLRQMQRDASPEEIAEYRPMVDKMYDTAAQLLKEAKPVAEGDRVLLNFATDAITADAVAATTAMLLPAVKSATAAAKRASSMNDLKQLALGLLNYESAYGHFPPAVGYEYFDLKTGQKKTSKHPHSWRVAILPFIEQQALYESYRFDEPWDSEHNKRIAETVVPAFQSPFDNPSSTNTSYFVLTGRETLFRDNLGTKLRQITDGTSMTLMVVEAKRDIPWTKPEDIPYSADTPLPKFGGWMPGVFLAARCDGSVQAISQDIDDAVLRALITMAGGEAIP